MVSKTCKICLHEKPLSDFPTYLTRKKSRAYRPRCVVCFKAHQKATIPVETRREYVRKYRRSLSAEVVKEMHSDYALRRSYGIDMRTYNTMLSNQQYRCAICGVHQDDLSRRMAVDHCHDTNYIRGLLCVPCNTGLGNFRENIELMNQAIEYLALHNKKLD